MLLLLLSLLSLHDFLLGCFVVVQVADRTGKGNRVLSTMSGSVIRVLAILAVAAAGVSAQCFGNCGGSGGGCFCGKALMHFGVCAMVE